MDGWLMAFILGLGIVGLLTLYAAVHQGPTNLWTRQCLFWFFGLIIFFVCTLIPLRIVALLSWPSYGLVLALLALVPVVGEVNMGARRWLDLHLFQVQPSELMKWSLILVLSYWFSTREATHWIYASVAIFMAAVPIALILLQPDLGTALVLAFAVTLMLIACGLPWRWLCYAGACALLSFPLFWRYMHDYQKQRIISFLNPESDPLGSGYHVIQSKIAIGSGGIFGKGYLQGTQARLHFLPEQHTDFIFAVLAEEGGLLASGLMILLYFLLLWRIILIAQRASSRFASLLCTGVASMLMIYVVVNIGMVTGMLPVVGVPLPFISYGGSALISILAAMGLVMRAAIESHQKIPWQKPTNPLG